MSAYLLSTGLPHSQLHHPLDLLDARHGRALHVLQALLYLGLLQRLFVKLLNHLCNEVSK